MRPEKFWARIAEFPFVFLALSKSVGESDWGKDIALSYELARDIPQSVKWIASRPFTKKVSRAVGQLSEVSHHVTATNVILVDTAWFIFFSVLDTVANKDQVQSADEHYSCQTHDYGLVENDETVGDAICRIRASGNVRTDAVVCMRERVVRKHDGSPRRAAAGNEITGQREKKEKKEYTVDVYILNPNLQ